MVPKVEFPQRVRTPDYLFNGSYYDLKTLKTVPPGKNPIFNPAKKCSGQTRKIIYDVTIPNLDPEVILSQVEKVFTDTETQFVDEIVIIRDRTIEKVYKRA